MKKLSFLALALLAVSAVTAAFIPSKKKTADDPNCNGRLNETGGVGSGDFTCDPVAAGLRNCYSFTQNDAVSSSGTGGGVTASAVTKTTGGVACVTVS